MRLGDRGHKIWSTKDQMMPHTAIRVLLPLLRVTATQAPLSWQLLFSLPSGSLTTPFPRLATHFFYYYYDVACSQLLQDCVSLPPPSHLSDVC